MTNLAASRAGKRMVRTLAERADPFTRQRLLALVGRYDPKVSGLSRASNIERPLPVRTAPPASNLSGQAKHNESGDADQSARQRDRVRCDRQRLAMECSPLENP